MDTQTEIESKFAEVKDDFNEKEFCRVEIANKFDQLESQIEAYIDAIYGAGLYDEFNIANEGYRLIRKSRYDAIINLQIQEGQEQTTC